MKNKFYECNRHLMVWEIIWELMNYAYTGADEIAGNRAPQWAAEGLDSFKLNALLCFAFELFGCIY